MANIITISQGDRMLEKLYFHYPHVYTESELINSKDPGERIADMEALEIFIEKKWVHERGLGYKTTPLGNDIQRNGGFRKFLERELEELMNKAKFQSLSQIQLTEEVRKLKIDNQSYNRLIIIGTFIVIILQLVITFLQMVLPVTK